MVAAPRSCAPSRDRVLLGGVLIVLLLGTVVRLWGLGHGLPQLVAPDEPLLLTRAQGILDGRLPTEYDWPSGSMLALSGWLRVTGAGHQAEPYLTGRWLFALVSLATVALTARLAHELAPARHRRPVVWVSALAIALAYPAVRTGRTLHPDPLQAALVVGSLLCMLRYARRPVTGWVIASAGLAGLAAGTKYVGGVAVLAIVGAVLSAEGLRVADRVRHLAMAVGASLAGFVAAVPALVTQPGDVVDGLRFQLTHQAGGHLGYDASSPSFWFQLSVALPAAWGWAFTLLAIGGLVVTARRGTRPQRLVAVVVVAAFFLLGSAEVRFPHYALVFLAPLAPFAALALCALVERLAHRPVWQLAFPVLLGAIVLTPAALNVVSLLRAEAATDTRSVAAEVARRLDERIIKEQYTDASGVGTAIDRVGNHPEILDCECVIEISSYNEDRYRREPARYATQMLVYDAVRRSGTVVATVAPSRRLSYRWDLAPQWGMGNIPLTGPVGMVGPTITFVRLP